MPRPREPDMPSRADTAARRGSGHRRAPSAAVAALEVLLPLQLLPPIHCAAHTADSGSLATVRPNHAPAMRNRQTTAAE